MEDNLEDERRSYGGYSRQGKTPKKNKSEKIVQKIKLTESDDKYPTDLPKGTKNVDFDLGDMVGVIREVTNQGNRRICWTIASTRSFSGHLIAKEMFVHPLCLSSLHLLVGLIDKVDSTGGLQNLEHLRSFLVEHGTVLEEDCKCPQLALEQKNDSSKPNPILCTNKANAKHTCTYKVDDLIILENVDESELIGLVQKGPVAVSMDVYDDFFRFKGSGIYTGPSRKPLYKIDEHMFLVTGYGTKMPEGIHFWKIQNSAGTTWGDKGYGKIIRQISRGEGEPSLFTCAIYPKLLDE